MGVEKKGVAADFLYDMIGNCKPYMNKPAQILRAKFSGKLKPQK